MTKLKVVTGSTQRTSLETTTAAQRLAMTFYLGVTQNIVEVAILASNAMIKMSSMPLSLYDREAHRKVQTPTPQPAFGLCFRPISLAASVAQVS